ncbi:hypothetical protein AK812_SmicGene2758 [Symbiodinium microadriaticum]|uniref:Uncharacterized protein n=1 Tax=Symbiodinium microadriaticum TaxID=2951 RepID=A0A1Q9F0M3_SYMMI|nr:hypothetical protein AK812_SmicGene2758 [Symbiodinium microadriaticum]
MVLSLAFAALVVARRHSIRVAKRAGASLESWDKEKRVALLILSAALVQGHVGMRRCVWKRHDRDNKDSLLGLDDLESEAERAQVREACASAFREREKVRQVDVFISHNWGARRWVKFLAMCFFLNLGMAVKATLASALIVAACMLLAAGSVTGLGGDPLVMPLLGYLPMSIFFLVFFFGQTITGGHWSPTLWLDKLCVLQTDECMKAKAISAFPVFLAHSNQMLVLWDDDYFERMWCNLELATFTGFSAQRTQKVEFVPMWLAPWLLAFILTDLVSVSALRVISNIISEPSVVSEGFAACDYLLMHTLGTDSPEARFFVYYVLICVVSCVSYYLTAIPAVVAVLSKMRKHSFMLEQMADFDIRAAKCTLESDRRLVEKRIGELLARRKAAVTDDGSGGLNTCLMMDHQNIEPLDCFNAYVRGPLKQAVLEKIGDGMHVPYHLCLVASLPMALFSLVDLLSCSDVSCQMQARELDLSVQGYMGGLAGFWLLNDLMIYPIAQPILFRVLSRVCCAWERLSTRIALGLLAAIILYTYIFLCSGVLLALSPFSVAAVFFLLL